MVKVLLHGCAVTQLGDNVTGLGLLKEFSAHEQMVKPLTKVKIQPGSSVLCEQGENIEWFRVNEKSGQIYPFVLFGFYLVVALGGFTVS